MNWDRFFGKAIVAAGLLFGVIGFCNASSPVSIDMGEVPATYLRQASSFTATAIFAERTSRKDGTCFNNTAAAVWLGTTSVTMNMVTHENYRIGIPVPSSSTFTLGGAFTGNGWYLTCGAGVASCEMRCAETYKR